MSGRLGHILQRFHLSNAAKVNLFEPFRGSELDSNLATRNLHFAVLLALNRGLLQIMCFSTQGIWRKVWFCLLFALQALPSSPSLFSMLCVFMGSWIAWSEADIGRSFLDLMTIVYSHTPDLFTDTHLKHIGPMYVCMYGIFAYSCHKNSTRCTLGRYTIHGSYGKGATIFNQCVVGRVSV